MTQIFYMMQKPLNFNVTLLVFSLIGLLLSSSCLAQDVNNEDTDKAADKIVAGKNAEEKSAWKSNIEFGYVATSGNTQTTSINGRFAWSYEVEHWRHSFDLKAIFGSAEDTSSQLVKTNAERYFAEAKTDYKYTEKGYAFILANYDDDRFSDNDYQAYVSVGRGLSIKFAENSDLDVEIGLGYRETRKKQTLTLPSEIQKETVFRLAGHYIWKISKNSQFEQKLSIGVGADNSVTKSYSGLSANIVQNLALKLSLTAIHQSQVRVDTQQLDTVTAFTLVYNF
ncbi:MAG: DUF481 domain-containing protein [Enterobacterales bacterium]|nr:DUF481 domain-containing protein [Enterobacterales bacterium]